MKKLNVLLISFFLISALSANAQTFKSGDLVGNLTIGFGDALYGGLGYATSVPPLAISGDYGIVDNVFDKGTIGIGGLIGYSSAGWNYGYDGYNASWNITYIVIGPRGTLHYPFVDKLDTYVGLMIGYDIVSVSASNNINGYAYGGSGSQLITAGFVGARYYFTDKFAGVCEIGWGIAYFNIGVSLKLK